jgi:hypothetical protein
VLTERFADGHTPFVGVADGPLHNPKILGLIVPGGRVAVSSIPARDLVDSDGRIVDIDALLAYAIDLRGGEMPTTQITTKDRLIMIWLRDSHDVPVHDLKPFAMRLVRKAAGVGTEEFLPNLGKRLTVFNRPFPVQIVAPRPVVRTGTVTYSTDGSPVRVVADKPFVRLPGQTVVFLVPKDKNQDGCIIIRRSLVHREVHRLHRTMVEATGHTRDTVDSIEAWGQRREVRKALDKADRVRARLLRLNWNVRLIMPMFRDLGGHLKGDAILSQDGFDMGGADIIASLDNLKPELFSTDGALYLFADAVHDSRTPRWTDRQTMIHHQWILKSRIRGAMERAHANLIESLRTNTEPEFVRDQRVDIETEFEDDNINVYDRRYALMRAAGVLNMSPAAIEQICNTRWLKKLAPDHRDVATNDDGEPVKPPFWLDTFRFPITASEFRSVKSQILANLAGYAIQVADGEWESSSVGVIVSNNTAIPLCRMCGGGDFDDHWCFIHGRAKFAITISQRGLPDLHFAEGDIFTVAYRLPIGVSSNGVELGTEYMILRPSAAEVEVLERTVPHIPVVDLALRPKTKDDLDWSAFPCPATCEDKDEHDNGHPQWTATPVEFDSTEYDFDVFRQQAYNLARQQAMGGVGAIANMDLVLYLHQIPFAFVCHTEDWVDLMTKSIGHADDFERWTEILSDRAAQIKLASDNGMQVDNIAFERVALQFPRRHGVRLANGLLYQLRLLHERSRRVFEKDRDVLVRETRQEMLRLTAHVQVERVVRERTGSYPMPRIIEHMTWQHQNLLALKREQGILNDQGKVKASASEWDLIAAWTWDYFQRAIAAQGRDPQSVIDELSLQALAWCYRTRGKRGHDQMMLNGPFLESTIRVLRNLRGPDGDTENN